MTYPRPNTLSQLLVLKANLKIGFQSEVVLTRYATRPYLRSQQVRAGARKRMFNKRCRVQMNGKLADFDVIYLHFMIRNKIAMNEKPINIL